MAEQQKWTYSIAGRPLLTIWNDQLDNRTIIGVSHPVIRINDVHLTILIEEKRLKWHVSDKTFGDAAPKDKRIPISGQISLREFYRGYKQIIKGWIKKYHGNKCCWIMTDRLKSKISNDLTGVDSNPNHIPLEILGAHVRMDFNNKERWKKIKIKDLNKYPKEIGFIIQNGALKMIYQEENEPTLCYSVNQYNKLSRYIWEKYGLDDYINYLIENGYLKDVKTHVKSEIKPFLSKNHN